MFCCRSAALFGCASRDNYEIHKSLSKSSPRGIRPRLAALRLLLPDHLVLRDGPGGPGRSLSRQVHCDATAICGHRQRCAGRLCGRLLHPARTAFGFAKSARRQLAFLCKQCGHTLVGLALLQTALDLPGFLYLGRHFRRSRNSTSVDACQFHLDDTRSQKALESPAGLLASFRLVRKSPHLQAIAALICLSSVVTTAAGWQLKAIAKETLVQKDVLAAFFGSFQG